MLPMVSHVNLVSKVVEARGYQLEAVAEVLSNSMLLILPTAAGKTAVAWMSVAEKLIEKDCWILMIAPTVALVDQHLKDMIKILKVSDFNPISITGQNSSKKRNDMWQSSRVIIATPQVVRNDIKNGILNLSKCSLAIFDEAHHSTGDHAMAEVGEMYNYQADEALILAMTASPGHKISKVEEICMRLKINKIHIKTSDDPLISEYLSNLEIQEIKVVVPEEIHKMAEPLKIWQQGIVDQERRRGRYVMPGAVNQIGLLNAMERAQSAIRKGDKVAYSSVSQIAIAMRLHHLINHLLCQGTAASGEFLNRMSLDNTTKSVRTFIRDLRIQNLIKLINKNDEIHSKITAVRRLVRERLRRDLASKIIIFATYRDTINVLQKALGNLKESRPVQFIGQSKRVGEEGLKPKEQIERLEEFKSGIANVLLSTSVGEEGLDIPSADLVIFYEPVSSETRTIQRRGRTGRHREGEVIVLVAEGTRDEGASLSARKREINMQRAVQRVKRNLPLSKNTDIANLDNFYVHADKRIISAADFVLQERDDKAPKVSKYDNTKSEIKINNHREKLNFKSSGQKGLDDFN
jgi:Fanconi anemia group M protein